MPSGNFKDTPWIKSKKVSAPVKSYVKRAVLNQNETCNITTQATIAVGAAATNYTGSIVNLQPVAQGLNVNDRVENVITPVKLSLKLDWDQLVAVTRTAVRTIVFRSKQQPNNTVPTTASVLASVGSGFATVSGYTTASVSNKLYDILYDKTIVMDTVGDGQRKHQRISLIKKINGRKIHYNGAGIADYGKGCLFMLIISDQPTATSPSLNHSLQLYYKP